MSRVETRRAPLSLSIAIWRKNRTKFWRFWKNCGKYFLAPKGPDWKEPSTCGYLPSHRPRLRVIQLPSPSVVILKNHLRVRIRHPPRITKLLRHIEDVVHL